MREARQSRDQLVGELVDLALQRARRLAASALAPPRAARACAGPGCATVIGPREATGRPRVYCSDSCRTRAAYWRRKRRAREGIPGAPPLAG